MSRTSKKRGQDEAVALDAKSQGAARVWSRLRSLYPEDVTAIVDDVAQAGGLTLHDLELLEVATHVSLDARIKQAQIDEKGSLEASLRHLQGQSRKHLRTLRGMMEPVVNPNKARHRDPESDAAKQSAKAKALADLARADVADDDVGDELVS